MTGEFRLKLPMFRYERPTGVTAVKTPPKWIWLWLVLCGFGGKGMNIKILMPSSTSCLELNRLFISRDIPHSLTLTLGHYVVSHLENAWERNSTFYGALPALTDMSDLWIQLSYSN